MAPRNRQPPESRTLRWRLRMRTYRARQLASLAAARRCGTWRSALIARVSGSEGGWSPRTTGTLSGRLDCRAPRWRFLKHHSYRFQSFRRGRHTEIQRPIGAHVWCHRPADAAAGNGRFPACRTGGRRPACRTTPMWMTHVDRRSRVVLPARVRQADILTWNAGRAILSRVFRQRVFVDRVSKGASCRVTVGAEISR
jgi:hypothetical protein